MLATRIPATVITGFLGAGKTTLIRRLIEEADGRRLALIVNEFGDIGVDGDVLAACGSPNCAEEDIIELANGCICCTVADDFLPSIQSLLAQTPPPDHIIIETSGLALPQPLVQAFSWPDIRSRVMLDGVVTVVDGAALAAGEVVADADALEAQRQADPELDHETPVDELFHDQVAAANLLIVSKSDLISADEREAVSGRLAGMTDEHTPVIVTSGDAAPLRAIFGLGLEEEAFARSKDYHHHHDHDMTTMMITIMMITIITTTAMMPLPLLLLCLRNWVIIRLSVRVLKLWWPITGCCVPREFCRLMARPCR